MKATELRIGNYIYDIEHPERECSVFRLTSGTDFSIAYAYGKCYEASYANDRMDNLRPIPLTEEWLLKFGFNMIDHSGTHFWSKDIEIDNGNHPDLYLHFHIRNNEIVNSGITSGEIDNEDGYEGERTHLIGIVKYVHQLQNLYFALTGEELTILN